MRAIDCVFVDNYKYNSYFWSTFANLCIDMIYMVEMMRSELHKAGSIILITHPSLHRFAIVDFKLFKIDNVFGWSRGEMLEIHITTSR